MKQPARESGLFKNGDLWWFRVRAPGGICARRSTGTSDLRLANRIAQMVTAMREERTMHEWLSLAASGDLGLDVLYNHYAAGTLSSLREERVRATETDPDLEPWVTKWIKEHIAQRVLAGQITVDTARDYERQIRTIIPIGEVFPRSRFNEDDLAEILHSLEDPRSGLPLTGSTKRRYLAPLRLFYRYARKRVPLTDNPFEDEDWLPVNNPPRSTYWDHETRVRVLSLVEDAELRAGLTLILGTGIELGPVVTMVASHVAKDRTAFIAGTKNDSRRDRTVFVDRWAWPTVQTYAKRFVHRARLFPSIGDGKRLREAFYEAQVVAGLIDAPALSKSGKKLWKAVNPHTLHDARHTYCYCRLLGLDGEPRESTKFCSHQLGHGSEQMVNQIYGKANLEARIRQLASEEERKTA